MRLEYYRKREIAEYAAIIGDIHLECRARAIRLTVVPNRVHVDIREIASVPADQDARARHAGCLTGEEDA
jgi:hypothetical protein